ncbi:Hypothetical predicted protein [Octopus vulgaris]|uniref:Uncharacterized protein n=1 Tax=Octopus vulgaris TaxID=6645 RepID=A0AA36BQQ1_OCTVU|nr:Hypothetical predicted protein [Octopus vulgaris]
MRTKGSALSKFSSWTFVSKNDNLIKKHHNISFKWLLFPKKQNLRKYSQRDQTVTGQAEKSSQPNNGIDDVLGSNIRNQQNLCTYYCDLISGIK